jgi:uncharacterized membrane protein
MKISMALTKGYKGDIFMMYLSFIGWILLGCITAGIAFLWVMPYIRTTNVFLYAFLKEKALAHGSVTQQDFIGSAQ